MVTTPSLLDIVSRLPASDLTRAARALGLTPTALMKRVESFESALGLKLVNTAAKALRPGEAGRLMIDHASRIFSQARDLTRDLEELAGLQAPEIVFGIDMFAVSMELIDVHYDRFMGFMSYWRYHVHCNGTFMVDGQPETVDGTFIAEYIRFR